MRKKRSDLPIHCVLIAIAALTLLPFVFVLNNSFRRTHEQYHSFFGLPDAVTNAVRFTWFAASGQPEKIQLRIMPETEAGKAQTVRQADVPMSTVPYSRSMKI